MVRIDKEMDFFLVYFDIPYFNKGQYHSLSDGSLRISLKTSDEVPFLLIFLFLPLPFFFELDALSMAA